MSLSFFLSFHIYTSPGPSNAAKSLDIVSQAISFQKRGKASVTVQVEQVAENNILIKTSIETEQQHPYNKLCEFVILSYKDLLLFFPGEPPEIFCIS
jgi:hypothetical protein